MGRALEPAGDEHPRRQDEQRHEPESPVEEEQPADRRDERQRVDDERRQPLVQDVGERVDVARQPGDDPAGLLLREVPERQRREVLEEIATQVEHHALTDAGEHQPGRGAEQPRDHADGDVRHDVADEPCVVAGPDPVVDRVADDGPAGDRRRSGDRGEQEDDPQAAVPALGVAPEP